MKSIASPILSSNVLALIREIVHTPVFDIILHLKKSTGMSVNELSREMDMSYMGVKQHCVELEKKRLLETWRRPKPTGRPEKIYRVTQRLDALFPQRGNEWTLDLLKTAERVFGERASDKLLFNHFQRRSERWQQVLRGTSLTARVKELAKLRIAEGYLTLVRDVPGALELVDHHNPCGIVADHYPLVRLLDRQSVEQALGVSVTQEMEEVGSLQRLIHRVPVVPS